jgi:hypothetical protein
LWPQLVDAYTGTLREVVEFGLMLTKHPLLHYLSTASSTEAFGYLPNFENNGGTPATAGCSHREGSSEAVDGIAAPFRSDDLIYSRYCDLHEPATPILIRVGGK